MTAQFSHVVRRAILTSTISDCLTIDSVVEKEVCADVLLKQLRKMFGIGEKIFGASGEEVNPLYKTVRGHLLNEVDLGPLASTPASNAVAQLSVPVEYDAFCYFD